MSPNKPAKEFNLPNLPPELRLQVWKHARPQTPNKIILSSMKIETWNTTQVLDPQYSICADYKISPLLQTAHESQVETQKTYKNYLSNILGSEGNINSRKSGIWVSKVDSILIYDFPTLATLCFAQIFPEPPIFQEPTIPLFDGLKGLVLGDVWEFWDFKESILGVLERLGGVEEVVVLKNWVEGGGERARVREVKSVFLEAERKGYWKERGRTMPLVRLGVWVGEGEVGWKVLD